MGTNFAAFSKQLQDFGTAFVPDQFRIFQIKIALELFLRIIEKTPVDTGRARGNWQIEIGEPSAEVFENRNEDQARTAGLKKVAGYTSGIVTIFITNNLGYISFLEDGSSGQAPRGMVAVSIEEVETIFAQVRAA